MKYHLDGSLPTSRNSIFVFGSNDKGIHGAGAARVAYEVFQAMYGVGEGRTGSSYAIPTKYTPSNGGSKTLDEIKISVDKFIEYAKKCSNNEFFITRIGCGYAGFTDDQIAPMFKNCPENCNLPENWKKYH